MLSFFPIIVGVVDGQLQPRDPAYPTNMIGLVASNAAQPGNGKYQAKIKQSSQKALEVILTN